MNGSDGWRSPTEGGAIRVIGWLSVASTLGWFFAPFAGLATFSTAWGVVLFAMICAPLILAGVHLGRASGLTDAERERWTNGLARFGPIVAWLYLVTKHKGSE
jgi:hypothetical protein